MACTSARKAYACSWAPQTTVIYEVNFSDEFWGEAAEWLYLCLASGETPTLCDTTRKLEKMARDIANQSFKSGRAYCSVRNI